MERIVKKLESKGIRPTPMRLLTYKKLLQSEVAISLGELENFFEKSERSTLFRTMKTFEEKNIQQRQPLFTFTTTPSVS